MIKYKNLIEKTLPEKNIRNNDLNKPYIDLLKNLNNDVINILKNILNMKYANIKINKKSNVNITDTISQQKLKNDLIAENKSIYLDYENIDFNRVDVLKTFNKGDVILFKFINATKTNNLFNLINLYLPYKKQNNNWQQFTELLDINYTYKYLSDIIDKNVNIYVTIGAINVIVGTITSSPFITPLTIKLICSDAVPLMHAIACLILRYFFNSPSNLSMNFPDVETHVDLIHSFRYFISFPLN